MKISILQYILSMSAYILILLGIIEVMRKHHKFAAVFWILALFTFPLWPNELVGWFRWAKTLSVLIPTALLVGMGRLAHIGKLKGKWEFFQKDWLLWALYGVLFLNIAEATLKDLSTGNYANGFAGIVLCITIPLVSYKNSKRRDWAITEKKPGDLIALTSPAWNFLYTTWNLAFVFGENPGYFASSFCILAAAELYPLLKKRPELYITARVYTLAFHILIRSTYDIFTPVMDSSAWASPKLLYVWGIVNGVLHLAFFAYWMVKRKKSNQLKPQIA
jgi:hypothetical protein